jgi:NAD(P) transhydrogenase subunit alpha
MKIGVPKEVYKGENRVATTPDAAERLSKLGFSVSIESGAGASANFRDEDYAKAGVKIVDSAEKLWKDSDIIVKVRAPQKHPVTGKHEADMLDSKKTLISFIGAAQNKKLLEQLADTKATVLAMESIPRISRAQKMDALSSMANIAGYKAVIEAAEQFGRFFCGQITAAGKIPPAKVMVIGAGVAGLSALGTAGSLGAITRAFDTRAEVKEQVESMGAEFLYVDMEEDGSGTGGYAKVMSPEFIKKEMALFAEQAKDVDIIITTALIPGKPAPELITEAMVKSMKQGSVIVDLAAELGGNCALTEKDKIIQKYGVTIIGYTDLPSRMPAQSSQLYATNIRHLFADLTPKKDGKINVNMDDEVIRGATVVHKGKITWPPPAPKLSAAPKPAAQAKPAVAIEKPSKSIIPAPVKKYLPFAIAAWAIYALGASAPASFMSHFTVFVLACFIGYMVIWNVSAALHTPLMSITNAISSIIIIGALLMISSTGFLVTLFSVLAILLTTINITGGFAVTHRMLKMFQK